MKLREMLNKMNKNDLVAIGAASSYFYFGEPDNFAEIEDVSKSIYIDSEIDLNDARNSLKRLPDQKSKLEEYLRLILNTYKETALDDTVSFAKKKAKMTELDKEIDKIVKLLARSEQMKFHYRKKVEHLIVYRRDFVPILDREVINHYRQQASDYAYVFIVEGEESGRFWTKNEYDSGISSDDEEELDEAI